MKNVLILFVCFIISLGIVKYENKSDVNKAYDESIYVFKYVDENSQEVNNPETDDLDIKGGIVVLFYSALFSQLLVIKSKMCNRYLIYNF